MKLPTNNCYFNNILFSIPYGIRKILNTIWKCTGKKVTWIINCFGVNKKTCEVVQGKFPKTKRNVSKEIITSPKNCSKSLTKIEEFIDSLLEEDCVDIKGKENDPWHEIVFDNNSYNKKEIKCFWKLHISPGSETIAVLETIKPLLLKYKPFCKIVQNQQKLLELENTKDLYNKKVFKGKCLTIYPKNRDEALTLSKEIDRVLVESNLINTAYKIMPCTDRPLGKSNYLWSRNDLTGRPIDQSSYQSGDHAHAMPGNYNTTVILPFKAYDFETDEKGRASYNKWYKKEFPNFQRIEHEDIFIETFGEVKWNGTSESDNGRFVNVTSNQSRDAN